MRSSAPDEPIPPPEAVPPSSLLGRKGSRKYEEWEGREESRQRPGRASGRRSRAIAEVPRRSEAPKRTKAGWNSTDFIVVLLAVGVLALSVVGLFWLLKG